jgi:serine/threonine-protein kinase
MADVENFPSTIGRYEIRALLGSGAMGSVYLAEDPRIKRKLAIKVVKVDAIRTEADRKEFLARFQREAEVSGTLNDPGIVAIYDVGDSEVGPFLAMEFVPGRTLENIIKSLEPVPLKTKLSMAACIASALDHAHTHNIVHRDVKPGNVMVTDDWRAKLMDFGIAKREDASLTQTGTFLGTPSYASPEQIKEGVATGQSDVFSFGVMVFELLSGSLPFPGTSINTILYRIVNEPPVAITPPVEGLVPDGWQRTFNKVLSKNPKERHASCSAFLRELLDNASDLGKTDRMQLLGSLRSGPGNAANAGVEPEAAGTVVGAPATVVGAAPTVVGAAPTVVGAPAAAPAVSAKGGGKGMLYAIAAAVVVAGSLGGFLLFRKGGGQLLLDTVPPNAVVLKDGKELGRTPIPLALQPGDVVKLQRPGFQSKEYMIKTGESAPKVELAPVVSEETLRSDPAGATVVLDGVTLGGVTPILVKAWDQSKKHQLNFTRANMGLATDLDEGQTPGSKVYHLEDAGKTRKAAVPVTVDANAPGPIRFVGEFTPSVKLDGKPKELGPNNVLTTTPGRHILDLASPKHGYKASMPVDVKPGAGCTVNLPELVKVTVETFPGAGTVTVDGFNVGVESDANVVTVTKGSHNFGTANHSGKSGPRNCEAGMLIKFHL